MGFGGRWAGKGEFGAAVWSCGLWLEKGSNPGLQCWSFAANLGKNSSLTLWFNRKLRNARPGRCGLLHMVVCGRSLIALNLAETPNPLVFVGRVIFMMI